MFFKKSGGRSFFLVDEQDEVESFARLDDMGGRNLTLGLVGFDVFTLHDGFPEKDKCHAIVEVARHFLH